MKSLGRDALVERLRGDAFGLSARAVRPLRVGLEAEMIAVDGTSGEPAPLVAPGAVGVLSLLDALLERGWEKDESRFGVPRYRHPGGGAFSLEPGAQIEYSSPAFPSVTALLADVERALDPLTQEAAARGLRLLTRGVDPLTRGARASLQLSTDRYRRMASHFARLGPWGHCMMCQTASVHVNLDYGESPLLRWRVANALAPVLTATFANSPRYAGQDTGLRSWRAEQWRRLDPLRTGLFASSGDPAVDYAEFALEAPALLLGEPEQEALPFRAWLERGAGAEALDDHLSTLFPEVRPRGYLELRSFDALPPRWYPAVVVPVVGILYSGAALLEAERLLPEPSDAALVDAGRTGLGSQERARLARDVFQLGLEGARRLGEETVGGAALEVAEAFYAEFTGRGRAPGDSQAVGFVDPGEGP